MEKEEEEVEKQMLRIYEVENGQRKRHTETNTNQIEVTFWIFLMRAFYPS